MSERPLLRVAKALRFLGKERLKKSSFCLLPDTVKSRKLAAIVGSKEESLRVMRVLGPSVPYPAEGSRCGISLSPRQ